MPNSIARISVSKKSEKHVVIPNQSNSAVWKFPPSVRALLAKRKAHLVQRGVARRSRDGGIVRFQKDSLPATICQSLSQKSKIFASSLYTREPGCSRTSAFFDGSSKNWGCLIRLFKLPSPEWKAQRTDCDQRIPGRSHTSNSINQPRKAPGGKIPPGADVFAQ